MYNKTNAMDIKIAPYIRKSPLQKPVLQFGIDGKFIAEYESLTEAARQTGVSINGICLCCKGQRQISGNFQWRYKLTK